MCFEKVNDLSVFTSTQQTISQKIRQKFEQARASTVRKVIVSSPGLPVTFYYYVPIILYHMSSLSQKQAISRYRRLNKEGKVSHL